MAFPMGWGERETVRGRKGRGRGRKRRKEGEEVKEEFWKSTVPSIAPVFEIKFFWSEMSVVAQGVKNPTYGSSRRGAVVNESD